MLFQAKRRTMDPNTSAIVAVWICNECIARMGQLLAAEPREHEGSTGGRCADLGLHRGEALDTAASNRPLSGYPVEDPGASRRLVGSRPGQRGSLDRRAALLDGASGAFSARPWRRSGALAAGSATRVGDSLQRLPSISVARARRSPRAWE
jgi:hypothetical protein